MIRKIITVILSVFITHVALAGGTDTVTSEERDATRKYIETVNYLVGRMDRDCSNASTIGNQSESLASKWQSENKPFVSASKTYMQRKLGEALKNGGEELRDKILRESLLGSREIGDQAFEDMIKGDGKEEGCNKALVLFEQGGFNFTPKHPLIDHLMELVSWARQNKPNNHVESDIPPRH